MADKIRYGKTLALKEYMIKGNRISRLESILIFGVQNLPEFISHYIKKEGFIVKTEYVSMAKILRRINKVVKCEAPDNLPVREIYVNEWWISE